MSSSNAWAEFAALFVRTPPAYLEHEQAKAELKGLVPEDAQQAIGHRVRAKRRNPAPLASTSSRWRGRAMQRSSETIGTMAAALAKAQTELIDPEKLLVATIRPDGPWRGRTVVPLCPAVERARDRAQDLEPA